MCESHCFGGIGNQITGDKRIFHSNVSHSDAVANGNRGKHDGRTACHCHAELYGIYDFVEIHMSRYDFVIGADNTNQRAFLFFFDQSQGVKQTAVRGVMHTRYYVFFWHTATSYQLLMSLSSSLQLYSLRISAPTTSEGCSLAFFLIALKCTCAPAADISRRKSLANVPS